MASDDQFPFQLQKLFTHSDAKSAMMVLSQDEYDEDIQWIKTRFQFTLDQRIRPTLEAIEGEIASLSGTTFLDVLRLYKVSQITRVHVVWAYENFGVVLPLHLVSKYLLTSIWFPVIDDVFVFDKNSSWCLELHHEGGYTLTESDFN